MRVLDCNVFMTDAHHDKVHIEVTFTGNVDNVHMFTLHAKRDKAQRKKDLDDFAFANGFNHAEKLWLIDITTELLTVRETYSEERVARALNAAVLEMTDPSNIEGLKGATDACHTVPHDANDPVARALVHSILQSCAIEENLVSSLTKWDESRTPQMMSSEIYGPLFGAHGKKSAASSSMFGFGGLGGGSPAQKRNSKGSNRGSVDGGTAAKRASKDGAEGDGVVLDAMPSAQEEPLEPTSPTSVAEVDAPSQKKSDEPRQCRACDSAASSGVCRQQ